MDQMAGIGGRNGMIISSSFHDHHLQQQLASSFMNAAHAAHAASSASSSDNATSTTEEEENYDDGIDDHHQLQLWAAIERLPTFTRLRTSLVDHKILNDRKREEAAGKTLIDVTKLRALERRVLVEKLVTKIEDDNRLLLQKLKQRIVKLDLELPTVQVRFQNLSVEAECKVVHGKSLPTLWNTIKNIFSVMINTIGCKYEEINKIKLLKAVSGIIEPSRLTLLLGSPGCGKTTLLQALAGRLNQSLQVTGEIFYNGYKFNEFVPQKTSTYISQNDLHISEMTVRETLDFSARCQGIGSRGEIIKEVSRREKQAGIIPEADLDTYMKAISVEGLKRSLQTEYILKILGLDICADTIVGDAMNRGISGGQKRRLTTGEMIIGPTRVLFMDEISNGLDSSTTFQIVTCLQQSAHITDSTILVSLLQPAPETFNLFDDIILMAERKIVYQGPRSNVLEFFEHCGFKCPPRKGVADFLQEVVSKKDQAQYWYHRHLPYSYVSVDMFIDEFKEFHVGQKLDDRLSRPFNKSECHNNSLSFSIYSLSKWELFKACLSREWLLMKRNSVFHVVKSAQLVVIALITISVFIHGQNKIDAIHANYYMDSLFYALVRLMTNGLSELSLMVTRLPILYKQRDFYFYPAWACSIPSIILKVPFSLLDAFLWTALTYYVIGYSPEPERFFCHFLLLFFLHQASTSLFRLIASVIRNPPLAASCGLLASLLAFLLGGFLIPYTSLPAWLQWGFWISPLTYAEIGVSVNEFLSPRWQKVLSSNTTLGHQVLKNRGLNFSEYFYWVSIAALFGFWIIFNIGFTLALTFLKSQGTSRTVISHEQLSYPEGKDNLSNVNEGKELCSIDIIERPEETKTTGMVLPFESITLTFENIQYFVDAPKLILMKGGGQMIYSGELGQHSSKLIEYFEQLTYWRSPKYNLVRLGLITISSVIFGALLWQKGQKIDDEQDFLMVLGAMYIFVQVMGISNSSSVIPFIATERTIVYRERFAGMYSSWAYSSAQVIIEIPYSFLQALLFSTITYPAINFYRSAHKVFLYFYTMFCTMLFFNYFGMMLVALTPSYQAASIFASFCHTMLNLFAGFLIPGPKIPKWWIWAYWICPTAWSLNGFITSQYGDIKKEIIVHGEPIAISVFLESNYGYQYKDLPVVATVLLAFPFFFAAAFAYAISKLNFQKR
ncbi:hypothetical protein EZV62_025151 [Acer yangbiense]|uniref:ABC transporter domain-containing protein n=1 Tax=Acer yangbiense TaxID=1000413 RepID=A0A5C7GZ33_9ROSI|nr:hypothetical protein EZV62_025151 [Acer yangbiense]